MPNGGELDELDTFWELKKQNFGCGQYREIFQGWTQCVKKPNPCPAA